MIFDCVNLFTHWILILFLQNKGVGQKQYLPKSFPVHIPMKCSYFCMFPLSVCIVREYFGKYYKLCCLFLFFFFLHPECILKTFIQIPKSGKDTTRISQIFFTNIDIKIPNKIQANKSSTLKGLYTMTKWNPLLEFQNGSTDKSQSMWYVTLIEWRKKDPNHLNWCNRTWQNSTPFHNKNT